MVLVAFGKRLAINQQTQQDFQCPHVFSALFREFHITFELPGKTGCAGGHGSKTQLLEQIGLVFALHYVLAPVTCRQGFGGEAVRYVDIKRKLLFGGNAYQ